MLEKIKFGTFYFFPGTSVPILLTVNDGYVLMNIHVAFCAIIVVWVWFFLPETKGTRIEDMDKVFGGNQGSHDIQRMAAIRDRLGLESEVVMSRKKRSSLSEVEQIESLGSA